MIVKLELDRIDFCILTCMQENAWMSTKQLSAKIGLSLSATAQRLKSLKDAGHLQAAHAVVPRQIMGANLEALFMIQLDKHDEEIVNQFLENVVSLPEVLSAFLITGNYDIVANIIVRDTDHLKSLAFEQFTNRPFITKIETSIVYNSLHSYVVHKI